MPPDTTLPLVRTGGAAPSQGLLRAGAGKGAVPHVPASHGNAGTTGRRPGQPGRGGRGGDDRHQSRAGRIGPNAIIQCLALLRAELSTEAGLAIAQRAGIVRHWDQAPTSLVDEREVQALHRELRAALGTALARDLGRRAGLATGDYLLAHRIPRPMRALLPRLPAALAARVLLAAIRQHAWTFCGSGRFEVWPARAGKPLRLRLTGSATSLGAAASEPLCDYFAATFERLFQVLVAPRTTVVETACMAMGASACEFELRW